MKAMKAAQREAVLDSARTQSKGHQLRPCHDPVLSLCELRYRLLVLTNVAFSLHFRVNVTVVAHAGQRGAPQVTRG
jgi:hypothetical protein